MCCPTLKIEKMFVFLFLFIFIYFFVVASIEIFLIWNDRTGGNLSQFYTEKKNSDQCNSIIFFLNVYFQMH